MKIGKWKVSKQEYKTDPNMLKCGPGDIVIIWGAPYLVTQKGLKLLPVIK